MVRPLDEEGPHHHKVMALGSCVKWPLVTMCAVSSVGISLLKNLQPTIAGRIQKVVHTNDVQLLALPMVN